MSTQTELAFLLDLLLNQKLPKAVQTLLKERIVSIEAQPTFISAPPTGTSGYLQVHNSIMPLPKGLQQPSTQARLDGHIAGPAPIDPNLPVAMPRNVSLETQPVVGHGNLKGPRKF